MVQEAQKGGLPVSCDIGIHHLHLTETAIGFFDSNARFDPPLRSESDRSALRAAVGSGVAAICSDTWGVEVRPNETTEANQPWHWVVIPAMGLTMGEIFFVKELAEDCAADGVYEFMFAGPPLVITHGTGSPINPLAIK